jgi:hypothetical protein
MVLMSAFKAGRSDAAATRMWKGCDALMQTFLMGES